MGKPAPKWLNQSGF